VDEGDEATLVVVVLDGDIEVTLTSTDRRPDLALVEKLARLHLAARRLGASVVLRDPCPRLRELLELVGLVELFGGARGSALQARREAEGHEQLGVEEVVERGDPQA
jgi:hypothetical protein